MAFLYTKDKWAEKEIRETTPFTRLTNNIKCLGVNLTKQVKDLYDKNYKSLKKEIKEDLRWWKDLPCSWIGRINIVKNGHLAESNLQIQCNPIKISNQFVRERPILKFIWHNNPPSPRGCPHLPPTPPELPTPWVLRSLEG
jgi:hypothetical protein